MAQLTFISDVHGAFATLHNITRKLNTRGKPELIIQLGDLGMGFHKKDSERTFPPNFRFIRGNHDSPAVCRAHPNYLGDYGYLEKHKLFFMSGAESIDMAQRIPNLDWWWDEQLSMIDLQDAIDLCVEKKPEIIVTHDAPYSFYWDLTEGRSVANDTGRNRTSLALDRMFELWQPKYWLFGHHHRKRVHNVNGTEFRCLEPLEVFTLEKTKENALVPRLAPTPSRRDRSSWS